MVSRIEFEIFLYELTKIASKTNSIKHNLLLNGILIIVTQITAPRKYGLGSLRKTPMKGTPL